MNKTETPIKRDKITELIWSKSKRYTVKEYKGSSDCTQYLTADEVFEIINSVKKECEKDWKEKVSEAHSDGYQKGKYEANVRNKRGY